MAIAQTISGETVDTDTFPQNPEGILDWLPWHACRVKGETPPLDPYKNQVWYAPNACFYIWTGDEWRFRGDYDILDGQHGAYYLDNTSTH